MADLLEPGTPAPPFEARDHDGTVHRLDDHRGRGLVLYFYPKDDTPGCRTEACGFRDRMDDYEDAGLTVLGVSTQDADQHRAFADRYDLNFPLLVDEGNAISKAYGAYGVLWVLPFNKRITYLIDEDGVVRHVWGDVDPSVHADEVLAKAAELGIGSGLEDPAEA